MNAVRVTRFHSWQLHFSFKPFAISEVCRQLSPNYVFDHLESLGVWHCVCGTSGIHIYTGVMSCVCKCVHVCIQVHAYERACMCACVHVCVCVFVILS